MFCYPTQTAAKEALAKLKTINLLGDNVKRLELALVAWVGKHDIALQVLDSSIPVLKNHVPDSQIIANTRCGRTKTFAIIRDVIGAAGKRDLVNILKKTSFSIIVDESTDRTTTKFFVILNRYFVKKNVAGLFCQYFEMPPVTEATAEGLKKLLIVSL